ncbi:hypothetical protein CC1G_03325 [Coprinopsis cinerea okayama7|uniref:Uncharacterized protein n=1 Tax=Coprinopsis cinerea (strain Okayama-7 / 130 / ATCC MYA-4618 / FGSC 9003) TaxID=240176 RepID=A8N7I2_COPC7|nr:hypothetical protein CC1G_03325 [Coprinopsis cinerea okayama7\|eukprot:XP_001830788.1 hypothetical protein CC1G_03325 [Coprinopsis cinerea okayama7\
MPMRNSSETESSQNSHLSFGRLSKDTDRTDGSTSNYYPPQRRPSTSSKSLLGRFDRRYGRVKHKEYCDCIICEVGGLEELDRLLDQFPRPPTPPRPRTRPPYMAQDFDDVQILPDHVYEERKRRRARDQAEFNLISYYRRKYAKQGFHGRVEIDPEDRAFFDASPASEALIYLNNNRSTKSLGADLWLGREKPRGSKPAAPSLRKDKQRVVSSRQEVAGETSLARGDSVRSNLSGVSVARSLSRKRNFEPEDIARARAEAASGQDDSAGKSSNPSKVPSGSHSSPSRVTQSTSKPLPSLPFSQTGHQSPQKNRVPSGSRPVARPSQGDTSPRKPTTAPRPLAQGRGVIRSSSTRI